MSMEIVLGSRNRSLYIDCDFFLESAANEIRIPNSFEFVHTHLLRVTITSWFAIVFYHH